MGKRVAAFKVSGGPDPATVQITDVHGNRVENITAFTIKGSPGGVLIEITLVGTVEMAELGAE